MVYYATCWSEEDVMQDLSIQYLGLSLKNPIIIGSGPYTSSIDNLKRCEDNGVGAVVLKSIFEEQIEKDAEAAVDENEAYLTHSDAAAFVREHTAERAIDAYLELISEAKRSLSIPVIASINCKSLGTWTEYADRFAKAGADAIEINYYVVAANREINGEMMERKFVGLVRNARKSITLPMAVKMGMFYSSLSNLLHEFDNDKVDGVVLFNRFFQNDIDIKAQALTQHSPLSSPNDYLIPLRWTALMSAELTCDICASSGIWSGESIVKQLLAGAASCAICSVVMKQGLSVVGKMLSFLSDWMEQNGYDKISDFKGKLAQENIKNPDLWERSQYMKALQGKGV